MDSKNTEGQEKKILRILKIPLDTRTCKRLQKPQGPGRTEGVIKTPKKVLPENNLARRASEYGSSPKTCVNPFQTLENKARKRSKLLKK